MASATEISTLYNKYLGRDPLQSGIDAWIATGQSIEQIEQGIANSPEAAVYETYQATLGREPEMEERQAWVEEINTTGSIQQAVDNITASPEAAAYQAGEELDILADTTAGDTTAGDITDDNSFSGLPTEEDQGFGFIETENGTRAIIGYDDQGRPLVNEFGGALNWEDSYKTASTHLGVTSAQWEEFINGINSIKERAYELDTGQAFRNFEAVKDRMIVRLLTQNPGMTPEEAEQQVLADEQFIAQSGQNQEYKELVSELNALYNSVGLDSTGAIQSGKTMITDGYAVGFNLVTGDVTHNKGNSWAKPAIGIAAGVIMGPAVGKALAGSLGVSGGFGVGAAQGAVSSALTQSISTGSIDPKALLVSSAVSGIGGLAQDMANAQKAAEAQAILDQQSAMFGVGSTLSPAEISALTDTVNKYGHLVELYGVDASLLGTSSALGFGEQSLSGFFAGATGNAGTAQFLQESVSNIANAVGLSYQDTLTIVTGIAQGAVSGEDVEGLVINALGDFSEVKIMDGLESIYGDQIDVKNWFKDGYTDIPVDSLQPLISEGIQSAIDGGVDPQDLAQSLYDYFAEGGSLSFILPDVDLPAGGGFSLPSLCKQYPNFALCNVDIDLPNITCPEGFKNEDGECLSVDININPTCPEGFKNQDGQCLPINITCPEGFRDQDGTCLPINITCPEGFKDVDGQCLPINISCPEGFKDDNGTCVPINISCPEGFKNENGECVPINISCPEGFKDENGTCVPINIDCPEGFKYSETQKQCITIVCPEGFKNENGQCVPINITCPEGFKNVNGECLPIEITCPEGFKNVDGQCLPIKITCPEGFRDENGTCVPINIDITTPCLGGKVRSEITGECECPPGKRENSLGICVDPIDGCPSGQQRNAEGVCEDIKKTETPDVDTPDVDIPIPSFEMPDINIPQFQPIQFQQPTQVTASPQLLTRTEFPITDYLSQAIQSGGMLTGNGNKIV